MATSSVSGEAAKSEAASSRILHKVVAILAGVASDDAGDALLTEELAATAGFGQPVGVEQQQVARLEGQLPGVEAAFGVEGEQRPGRPKGPQLGVLPQPGRGMAGRGVAQGAGGRVEDDRRTPRPGPRAGRWPTAPR